MRRPSKVFPSFVVINTGRLIKDENRIFPGDGIAPITTILHTLAATGATTALSLELFNREYWKLDALEVLKNGIAKMKASVDKAFA